ncbi:MULTISPECIES: fimbrial protein [Pseudomonas]|jgi:type 1 fimbria pilin|uniref:Pilus assembly protein n=2 Tax=Pseudomonas TaxID=286 RepID=A0A4Y9TLL9_PSEFL|nr:MULTISPECIES: fimbrial protein [Pseudomonas]CRM92498.1 putative minor fimbrial subunit StfF [Pseudomonas sp. 22 E 5]MCX9149530.1 fimbrial protein [Pseudomonas sp. TB1-B1]QXH65858.1 fimbrial protein [Pseudomonas asgharzadehiana]TFW45154.1 pilus assembly protein [Pseudomonas fluorescens]TKJ65796.1 pilus assembly protein [Pseudomonas sp. CFBP13506]
MTFRQQRALFFLCAVGLHGGASANVTFSGTLNEPPPCTIEGGNTIEVDFGDVGVKRVDGVKYRKHVGYTITCGTDTLPWVLKLSVNGTPTTFDGSAVQTSVPALGIRVFQDSQPFPLNTPLDITLSSPPTLEVVPVQQPGATLSAASFTAVATLLAEYQ